MGRGRAISTPVDRMPGPTFAHLIERATRSGADLFRFYLGFTYLDPPAFARLDAQPLAEPRLYDYAPPSGDPALVDVLVDKVRARNGLAVERVNVQPVAGATHAFGIACRIVADAGEEILLLAPYWPLIRGSVCAAGATPVEVPFSQELYRDPDVDVRALVEPYITPRTVAIYFATPNNPDGKVLDRRVLEQLAEIALRHDLWVLADEVYEDLLFDDRRHLSIASLDGMFERTITGYSISKSYAMAGVRVGYVVAPPAATAAARKLFTHSAYSLPLPMQRIAQAAIQRGEAFLAEARREYQRARDRALDLVAPLSPVTPDAATYLFLDLSRHAREGEPGERVILRLADAGLVLAPGESFGLSFGSWARLCFTAVPPARLEEGLRRLLSVLGR